MWYLRPYRQNEAKPPKTKKPKRREKKIEIGPKCTDTEVRMEARNGWWAISPIPKKRQSESPFN